MNANAKQRLQLLEILYAAREKEPRRGWVAEYDLRNAIGDPLFALSVLEELGHIVRDGNTYRITGPGVLVIEGQQQN